MPDVIEVHEKIRSIDWQPSDSGISHILAEKPCARKAIWATRWGPDPWNYST